jgi:hypothetical protein
MDRGRLGHSRVRVHAPTLLLLRVLFAGACRCCLAAVWLLVSASRPTQAHLPSWFAAVGCCCWCPLCKTRSSGQGGGRGRCSGQRPTHRSPKYSNDSQHQANITCQTRASMFVARLTAGLRWRHGLVWSGLVLPQINCSRLKLFWCRRPLQVQVLHVLTPHLASA